jgi:hypothetical protein
MGFKDYQHLEPEDFLTEEEHDYLVELVIKEMQPRNGGRYPPGDVLRKIHRFMHRPGIPLPMRL